MKYHRNLKDFMMKDWICFIVNSNNRVIPEITNNKIDTIIDSIIKILEKMHQGSRVQIKKTK